MSCFNREKEVEHGANSKGSKPRKWAQLLCRTLLELEYEGKRRVVNVGLCSGRAEAERLADRRWPGAKIVEVVQDGTPGRLPAQLRTGILPAGRGEKPAMPSEHRTQRTPVQIEGL
ncbi:hypothetical protein [Burkholderia vietnamiensis]|uniref:hypothetical protein n=1 Tax=Burkholderia vietnamiensis TaxID=60552 RepID=UPI0012D9EC4A|nr:hypothetical protein [Burkholderia vietnamiensis]